MNLFARTKVILNIYMQIMHTQHSQFAHNIYFFRACVLGMLGSCIAILVIALLYEGLKVLREHLQRRALIQQRYRDNLVSVSMNDANNHVGEGDGFRNRSVRFIEIMLKILIM